MNQMRAIRSIGLFLVLVLAPRWAAALDFEFRAPAAASDPTTTSVMRDLAERILPVYQEPDTERYLANLAALQMVAGTYTAAYDTRQSLRERQRQSDAHRPLDPALLLDLYAQARSTEARDRVSFSQGFNQSFRDRVAPLGDRDAYTATRWLEAPLAESRDALQAAFDKARVRERIELAEALDLIWKYLAFDTHRSLHPLVDALDREEGRRRYVRDENVLIKTRAGVEIHALVIRPKSAPGPLPALLEFTIETSRHAAEASAAHGYVGVVAYTRGKKGKSRNRVVPFEHDGEDAQAVIEWIATQAWSDGRVGMMGDAYSGFAAWAAAKRRPSALKAIATTSATAPGIDFPMTGHVFPNSSYRWAQTHTSAQDAPAAGDDDAQWRDLDQAWYRSGKPYRDLDRRFGKPNRIFRRWLNHPSYDRYWQKLIPFGKQFARIDIPVLTTAGYYGGDAGALHYFTQHLRYKPQAAHTLLVGPYDDESLDAGTSPVLRDYPVDPVALVDLRELRYQWFDHVLKGGAKPALFKDRVNYQLMGSNQWRHAPSIKAMADGSLRFYLVPGTAADGHRLLTAKPGKVKVLRQTVNLADRRDTGGLLPAAGILGKRLPPPAVNGLSFVSEPLQQATEFSGLLSGALDFAPNKLDVDLNIALYELLPSGAYVQLFDPYEFRASYARDRVHRQLLKAGERQSLKFTTERLTSRRLQAGSRVLLVLGVNQRPDREINAGSGKDVSEESIDDASSPLKIRWYSGSYIELPIRK